MAVAYRAYAPASAANLSVGFDLLGLALAPVSGEPLGDFVTAAAPQGADGDEIVTVGRYRHMLPEDPAANILHDALTLFAERLREQGRQPRRVRLVLDKGLPVCSGLGSSAASVVAAVAALNAWHEHPFDREQCARLMGELEGRISGSVHYDNVAPSYFGGLQLIAAEPGVISQTLQFFDDWYIVSCFPGVCISTAQARAILPAQYRRQDAITFARRLALFVHACHIQDGELAARCMVDVMAEPYRARLIPNFHRCCEHAGGLGAIATGISGSGSSVFSLFRDAQRAADMQAYLERSFICSEDGFAHICRADKQGARVDMIEV